MKNKGFFKKLKTIHGDYTVISECKKRGVPLYSEIIVGKERVVQW